MHLLAIETIIVFTLTIIIDILVVLHILMNKHEEPPSAILWISIVISFPIFGVILYLFFGINRLKTLGVKIQLANQYIKDQQKNHTHQVMKNAATEKNKFTWKDYKETDDPININKTLDNLLPNTTPLSGNKITLLHNGTMAYPRMLKAIQAAKHNINLQSYIINNDQIGKKIMDTLVGKAQQGVKVKVLYDAFGSLKAVATLFFIKYRKNIPNFKIRPFTLINLFAPWRVQLRNHRKLLITDGKIAFVGGINISDDNDIYICNKNKYIHDLHCKIEGPAVSQLQFSFLRDWYYATKKNTDKIFQQEYFPSASKQGEAIVRIIDSGPGQQYAGTEQTFATMIATAKHSIWIMTPYFTPDKSMLKSIIIAAARGVKILLIVPKHNDHWYAQFASRSHYPTLLQHDISIYEKSDLFSHTKAAIVDNKWAFMGSSNWDVRSFRLNYELDFIVKDEKFIFTLEQQFVAELKKSIEITWDDLHRKKLPLQLLENVCSLLTPIL